MELEAIYIGVIKIGRKPGSENLTLILWETRDYYRVSNKAVLCLQVRLAVV